MPLLALQQSGNVDREGVPLVMVHGFLCAGAFFRPVVDSLGKHHRVITVDLPGFGDSSHLAAVNSVAAMATAVRETLAAHGCDKYHLLGHSMGGMVALQLALSLPAQVTSLIVYASNSSGNLPDRFESFTESKRRMRENFSLSKRRICATWFVEGEDNQHFDILEQCATVVTLATAEKAIAAMSAFDVNAQVGRLAMPTLIISAEKDRTYSLICQEQLHARMPQAQWRIIKNCAHCAHLEDENAFNQLIAEWLDVRMGIIS